MKTNEQEISEEAELVLWSVYDDAIPEGKIKLDHAKLYIDDSTDWTDPEMAPEFTPFWTGCSPK